MNDEGRRRFLQAVGAAAASLAIAPFAGASSSGGSQSRPRRRNVILIVSDEHQAATCGCYGSKVRRVDGRSPTPHIDALAAEGVRFDAMYCAAPLCAPSRAAYITGTYPHTTTALHHKMQDREAGHSRFPGVRQGIPAMGEYFRQVGYRTAAFGKMHVHGEQARGWDLGFDERGLRYYTHAPGMHYEDLKAGDVNARYRENAPYANAAYREIDPQKFAGAPEGLRVRQNGVNQHFLPTLVEHDDEMFDHLVTEESVGFIERQVAAGEPFFIHVGLEKPHRPWSVPRKYLDRFNPDEMPLPATIAEWVGKGLNPFVQQWCHSPINGAEARRSIAAYHACASQVDDCVGRVVEKCRELGILEQTIIIYTSDHGESLYEHGLIEKHNMLEPAVRVPCIIRAPGLLPCVQSCDSPASLLDLLPTLCDLTATPTSSVFEGVSLLPTLAGEADPARLIFSEFYQAGSGTRLDEFLPVRMGLNRDYKYIYTHAAADQLYDRRTDDEQAGRNLAFDPKHEAAVSHLKLCTLASWELDEFPMLEARASVSGLGVEIAWEEAAPGARYDVYRAAGADPRQAQRVAHGLIERVWVDRSAPSGATCSYWVLGHYHLDQPYVDPEGKSRYGAEPILSSRYPRSLPVTPRVAVEVREGFQQTARYRPLLGCRFGELDWIHIGMPPVPLEPDVRFVGPVTVLTPREQRGPQAIAADIQTPRSGPGKNDTLQVIFGYLNMLQYYAVGLQRDGTLALWKHARGGPDRLLASTKIEGVAASAWQRVEISCHDGAIQVKLNGRDALAVVDPAPYRGGRVGFDTPLHVTEARVRAVTVG
jgi:choline-sulfatase